MVSRDPFLESSCFPSNGSTSSFNTGPLVQDTRSQDTWVVVVAVGIRILVIVVVVLVVVVVVEDRVRVDRTVAAVLDDTSVGEAVAGMLAVAVAGSLLVTDRAAADIAAVVGVVEHILLHSTAVGDDWGDRPGPTTDWVWEGPMPNHDQNDCDRPTSRLLRPPNVHPPLGDVTPAWMWASYWWNNLPLCAVDPRDHRFDRSHRNDQDGLRRRHHCGGAAAIVIVVGLAVVVEPLPLPGFHFPRECFAYIRQWPCEGLPPP